MFEIIQIMNNNSKISKISEDEYLIYTLERDVYIEYEIVTIVYGDYECLTRRVKLSSEEYNALREHLNEIIRSR